MTWVIVFFLSHGPWEVPYQSFETEEKCYAAVPTIRKYTNNNHRNRYPSWPPSIPLFEYTDYTCIPKKEK